MPSFPGIILKKIGLIRAIPTDVDVSEIINDSISPCKILKANRLNRRARAEDHNLADWIPSETILLTFEGTTLPEHIKIFDLYNTKVHVYVNPVKTCKNCYRYGHSTKYCRSTPVCGECGKKQEANHHSCNEELSDNCLHCKGNHLTFPGECPQYHYNKKINGTMAYESKGYWDAKEQVDKNIGLDKKSTSKDITHSLTAY